MKVIDLLNKIANGEEVPKKIKYKGDIWIRDFEGNDYYYREGDLTLLLEIINDTRKLDEEVEIIEEDKKIEKLDIRNEKNCKNNWKWKVYGEEHSYNISTPQKIIADKINEIIDYLEENKE